MVVEYIRYTVPAVRAEGFVAAYQKASEVLDADPYCLAYEVARGVEEPEHFVVRIPVVDDEGLAMRLSHLQMPPKRVLLRGQAVLIRTKVIKSGLADPSHLRLPGQPVDLDEG